MRTLLTVASALVLSACAARPLTPEMQAYSTDTPIMVPAKPPQFCVGFARDHSGVALYGDAVTWWAQAKGRYLQVDAPRIGSVLVLADYAGPKHAHLAVVTRIISAREIRVDHANWLNDGNIYLNSPVMDSSAHGDWSIVRVWNNRDDHMGIKNYKVQGFIAPIKLAGR